MKTEVAVCWFRRDLRLEDNAALYHALRSGYPVQPVFIFDKNILDDLRDPADRRVHFIHTALCEMQEQLITYQATLHIFYGNPFEAFDEILGRYNVREVYSNHDYEPYARERDSAVQKKLEAAGISFHSFKDQVIFEKNEILKGDGTPYTVFTPYSRRWKAKLNRFYTEAYPLENYYQHFHHQQPVEIPSLQQIGFSRSGVTFPGKVWIPATIKEYAVKRDIPAAEATTRLSVHLRFGTISIRMLVREAGPLSETFLNELIWRDFYHMILWHFPKVVTHSFKPEYDKIEWRNDKEEFNKWCTGKTGYPIVDAGMRELNATGYMHNRVRMIVASFLTRHLLIDWRLGEAWFAEKLLDYDLAANNGGWQWAAGSGCDAAPYFRIFNPYIQEKKFDPDQRYIRKWVPELDSADYSGPVVEHELARQRCLQVYKKALAK
ncbi:MAG TPA: deoxyribodipyrimidine photo-lyase [Chitinophagaceae bacterium]|nr:deoxyribodipyrimidine photo-lyase [Chitinophagaceae bacterium]